MSIKPKSKKYLDGLVHLKWLQDEEVISQKEYFILMLRMAKQFVPETLEEFNGQDTRRDEASMGTGADEVNEDGSRSND